MISLRLTDDLNTDNRFAWNAPTVADVKPSRGNVIGGDEINVGGFNFGLYNRDLKEVIIRGVVCTNPKALSQELIQCISGNSVKLGAGIRTVIVTLKNGLSSPKNVCPFFEYFAIKKEIIIQKPLVALPPPCIKPKKPIKKQPCIFKNGKPCCQCKPIPGVNYKTAKLIPILHKNDYYYHNESAKREEEDSSQLLFDMPKVGLRKNRFKMETEEELTEQNEKIYKHIIESEKIKQMNSISNLR